MEHIKKYWYWYLIGLVILIAAIWYFSKKKKSGSTETKKIESPKPTIYEAKKELERKLAGNNSVISIGTRQLDDKSFIQVGVKSEDKVNDIKSSVLTDGKWWDFPVDVIVEQPPVTQKESKTKWKFTSVSITPNASQKRLTGNIIPDSFQAGKITSLRISQTPEFTYDVDATIISIAPDRKSMLVKFKGMVSSKATGEAQI